MPDLSQFHLVNNQGIPKDVFDSKIVEYLVKHMDLMIYNNVLYIYVGGVYVKDKEGRMIKPKIQTLIYDELQTSIRINRVYAPQRPAGGLKLFRRVKNWNTAIIRF